MRLQAAVNGARRPGVHPRLPVTPEALAADAAAVVAAGADALHVHVRGPDGAESYAPAAVAATLGAIRSAVDVPVGVSTGRWVVPDAGVRHATVAAWTVLPDFASVNFHEPGAPDLARLLLDRGVAVEAGCWDADSVQALVEAGLADACVRVLLEPVAQDLLVATATLADLLDALRDVAPGAGRLLHGYGATTWAVLARAAELGFATRIGLEDTLDLPDGRPARDNAALITAARAILDDRP